MSYLNDYALNEIIRQHQQEIQRSVSQQRLGDELSGRLARGKRISTRKRLNWEWPIARRIGIGMISLGNSWRRYSMLPEAGAVRLSGRGSM